MDLHGRDHENEDGNDGHSIWGVQEDQENNRSDAVEVDENEVMAQTEDEAELLRRRTRAVIRLQLRYFASRDAIRLNRFLNSVNNGLNSDTNYVGNPGDYVNDSEYEAVLQNLAESGDGGRRGAPPAAKVAMEELESVVIGKEEEDRSCAICKDLVNVSEIVKKLPCGHRYHGECIETWLGSRNSCPLCRFELPTDDQEYEEGRRKRLCVTDLRVASTSSTAGDGDRQDSGSE